jgi:hypothetical protein
MLYFLSKLLPTVNCDVALFKRIFKSLINSPKKKVQFDIREVNLIIESYKEENKNIYI